MKADTLFDLHMYEIPSVSSLKTFHSLCLVLVRAEDVLLLAFTVAYTFMLCSCLGRSFSSVFAPTK